ncbi:MAG: hypothetical protein HQK81_04730 [Desulfovibrionaceae bacterium]|nr:hypothetical protein [Desulfovibrionaceae bacterium]MBF0513350.1 hypothetical protein [Desulfovibrionaceae bacterium]
MPKAIAIALALAALAGLCLVVPAGALADSAEKYFQNSHERLTALSGEAGKLIGDIQNPAEKITVSYLIMVGVQRAASADLIFQLLDIGGHLHNPKDIAYVQTKIAALRQGLPLLIKADIKSLTEIAGNNKNQDIAAMADAIVKELKVLLNNLENLSFPQP